MESQKRILITGGAGYIGSQLVKKALQNGLFVHVLDYINPNELSFDFLNHPKLIYFTGSLTDDQILKKCTENVDYIVHLAGVSDGKAGKLDPEKTRKINIDTLDNLLSISKNAGVKRFIFASTMGVYGNQYKIPLTENMILHPIDPYSESKAVGEDIVRNANTSSFSTVCLRMAMIYGISPNMRFDFILNRLTIDALQKKQLTVMGGTQKRPQIHIDDLCELFLHFFKIEESLFANQCYNVVGENPSVNNMIDEIQKQINNIVIQKLQLRENEDSFEMDGSKLFTQTNYHYQRNIKIGIREIIETYLPKNMKI
ncbi:MAG: SDR family oxidoreductase [Flavobacterium sp.]|nr:SDR family oxidoreductase [Flavobacterium sp.]